MEADYLFRTMQQHAQVHNQPETGPMGEKASADKRREYVKRIRREGLPAERKATVSGAEMSGKYVSVSNLYAYHSWYYNILFIQANVTANTSYGITNLQIGMIPSGDAGEHGGVSSLTPAASSGVVQYTADTDPGDTIAATISGSVTNAQGATMDFSYYEPKLSVTKGAP
jgi:hypothetical protein